MALSTKTIKRRIKSVSNTKKITRAMEMISAVKMRRAVAHTLATRNYSRLAWEMLLDIAQTTNIKLHPLLAVRPVKKIGLVLVTSNRGLAGGFTTKLLQQVHEYIGNMEKEHNATVDVIVLGKRGRKIYTNFGHTVIAEYEKIEVTTDIAEVRPLAHLMIDEYTKKNYDKISVAYTDFFSAIRQLPRVKQILPLKPDMAQAVEQEDKTKLLLNTEFKFEPSPIKVLEKLLPRLIEMQIYQAVLESDASEHSSRMFAMRNASDAASDMIKELNTTFNKARQAAITQEIAEVVGGAAAVE
jgi:F-type H+-transporting ATPase subunit gamma